MDEGIAYTRTSLSERWRVSATRDLDPREGLPAVLRMDVLDGWNDLKQPPDGRVQDQLMFALAIAPFRFDHPHVTECLQRCLRTADAAAHDGRWSTMWSTSRSLAEGVVLASRAIAAAWLQGGTIDLAALSRAGQSIVHGASAELPVWSELAQSQHLHAVQLALIASDVSSAGILLRSSKSFTRVQSYFQWHVELLHRIELARDPTGLRAHMDEYFDRLRDPGFRARRNDASGNNLLDNIALVRLRLALIRWIYIERQPIAGNWRNIIAQIGY